MNPQKTVLIAGCGYVGTALGMRLMKSGVRVSGLRRNVERLPEGIERIAADLRDPKQLSGLQISPEAVVFCAGPGGSTDHGYQAVYVEAFGNLINHLEHLRQSPRRLIFVSSTGVYGQTDGSWVNEDSPATARGFRAERLREGEALARSGNIPSVIVRFGGIYGPGRPAALERALAGLPVASGGRDIYTNRIHRDDCAGILEHILNLKDAAPIYLGVDSDPASRETVRAWLSSKCGHLVPSPKTSDPEDLSSNKRCSNKRILDSGYKFAYPTFREGFSALLGGSAYAGW